MWLVAAHIIATPVATWLAIIYSALGAPWREVHALWHAQAILLGTWYGLSTTSPARMRWMSLAGLLWLCAMPTAKELSQRGLLRLGLSWTSLSLRFGLQPLYLFVSFTAAALALAFATTVWPRCRVVATSHDSDDVSAPQFSMKQMMIAVTVCTPVLLLARLAHDHIDVAPVHSLATVLLDALFGAPPAAVVALLSTWAALGRRFVVARLAVTAFAIPVAVFLVWYAEKYPSAQIVGHMIFEETQLIVALLTLLLCRWNGYRIERTE